MRLLVGGNLVSCFDSLSVGIKHELSPSSALRQRDGNRWDLRTLKNIAKASCFSKNMGDCQRERAWTSAITLYLSRVIIERHSKTSATSPPSLGPPTQPFMAFTLQLPLAPCSPRHHDPAALPLWQRLSPGRGACPSAWHPCADPHCCSVATSHQ